MIPKSLISTNVGSMIPKYAEIIHESMHTLSKIYTQIMSNNHGQNLQRLCQQYGEIVQQRCKTYAKHTQELCKHNAKQMKK